MKNQPGQVVLDAIDQASINIAVWDDSDAGQSIRELRTWRAAFKKMAGAVINGGNEFSPRYYFAPNEQNHEAAKAILNARAVEARRTP